jgi:SAM-dependent methyltransferase
MKGKERLMTIRNTQNTKSSYFIRCIARTYFWLTERLYNEFAWFYDAASWIVSLGHWSAWRLTALDYIIGEEVLEIGFGTGELLIELAHRDVHTIGLEASQSMHRISTTKLRRFFLEIPLIRGLIQQMPFQDGCFDSIIATFPAGYIFDPATWREVARLLHRQISPKETVSGRFIIIGLFVIYTGKLQLLRNQPQLEQSSEEITDRINQLAQAANLTLRTETRRYTNHELPIFIAETLIEKDS